MKHILPYINSEAGRYLLSRLGQKPEGKIIKVTKNSFIERLDKKHFRATFFSKNPIERIFQPIVDKINISHEEYKQIKNKRDAFLFYAGLKHSNRYPQIYLASSTFNSATGANSPVDGDARKTSVNDSFANLRAANGDGAQTATANDYATYIDTTGTTDVYATMVRSFFLFDTSVLTGNAIIASAVFSTYVTAKGDFSSQSNRLVAGTTAANNTIANSDYQGTVGNTTALASDKTLASISTSAFADYTLNASGVSNINKTGISKFGLKLVADATNTDPGWVSTQHAGTQVNYSDAGSDIPKLVVEYSLGAGEDFTFFM